jgi:hypothetical protein
VEQQFRNVRQRFTSEVDFRNELSRSGFQTPEEFRRWLTDSQRKAALRNRLVEKLKNDGKLKPVQPTEKEMREYFDQYREQLPQRPATVSFRNIVISPKPSVAARDRARALADSIARALRWGANSRPQPSASRRTRGKDQVATWGVPLRSDGAGLETRLAEAWPDLGSGRVP